MDNVILVRDLCELKIFYFKEFLFIYLVYWIVWVDENGRINFRNDIY